MGELPDSIDYHNLYLLIYNRLFPNLAFCQVLLFRLYLRKFANSLVIYPQKKIKLQILSKFSH